MNPETPIDVAARAVDDARRAGDRRKEAAALTDLGVLWVQGGDKRLGAEYLVAAIKVAEKEQDKSLLADALGHLGVATAQTGHLGPAIELLERSLAAFRAAGDRFGEKAALLRLGQACGAANQRDRAAEAFGRGIELALQLGDRGDEAEQRWSLAILHAERGDRGAAVAEAETAANLYASLGHPHAAGFAEQLQKFRAGDAAALPAAPWQVTLTSGFGAPAPPPPAQGPGLLRMALSAAKALTAFVGSGLKTLPAEARDARLAVCAACEHHTGQRCRLCGCFTAVKSRLPHERCPAGRWPLSNG